MIQLVGPGGSGKTTAGTSLAQRLGVTFIDLDAQFLEEVGDISAYLSTHGDEAYAERNVSLYAEIVAAINKPAVLVLSSGFMTYRLDIHPKYAGLRRDIAASPSTFVLLPALECEACVAEIIRRQSGRPFARSPEREEQVIRARFPIYLNIPARKVETMRPVEAIVDELIAAWQPAVAADAS